MSNNWRQYGGIRKQEKFHNLNIGTLVADQVLLRESYAGKFKIPGSIYVGSDVYTIGNTYTYTNNFTTYDSYVGKNFYINKKIYFGTQNQILDGDNTRSYIAGDFSSNTIGINTLTPVAAFDINAINTTQTDILSISSSTTQIRNVLGKNANNRGIAMRSTDANSLLGFYVDTSLNFSNTPDAELKYTSGGNMYYLSTNNNIISGGNTIITASGSTFISSQTLMNITAAQSTTINTQNTNILSKVAISNRGQPVNMFNESTIIYDISNGLYLYDAYENQSAKSGSALTLVATDNASDTVLRMITPNRAGLAISAGTYPNDQTRALSAIGITDTTGKYRVNQTSVTGNSAIKHYVTTGFNTYAPRSETYVMDINGPTHISNGEVNKMIDFPYEVFNISFSKSIKTFGIAAGSPSPSVYSDLKMEAVDPQYIYYTIDGGITWSSSRVDATSDLETTPKDFVVYTYDNKYALLGSTNSFFYYTLNGGINWWLFLIDDGFSIVRRDAISMYIGEYNGNTKTVFIIYKIRGRTAMNMLYFTLNFTTLPNQKNIFINNYSTNYTQILNLPITIINANDGYDGFVYFVGTGINKYQTNPLSSDYLINTNQIYYDINCFNTTYAVAVGINIISYTYDGTNWTNITLSNTAVGNVTLRSIYLYDTNIGMAVGDGGIFLYTNNGARTWSIVPNSILNTSGYAYRINGPHNALRNISMIDSNTMAVTSVKQKYLINSVNGATVITSGLSKLYMCHIPNLYNRATNKVFDVSGNMAISGDINLNDGGNLITNNSTFNLINNNATTINFAGAANNIYIGNVQTGKTYLQHNFDVSGNVTMHEDLFLLNDFSMNGKISIGGSSIINGDLSVNTRLYVGMDASFLGNLFVRGNLINDMSFEYMSTLTVEKTMFCKEHLIVYQDASFTGNVYIGGPNLVACNTIVGSTTVKTYDNDTISIGSAVSGPGIAAGTIVTSLNPKNFNVTLSIPATATATDVSLSFINTKIFHVTPDTSLNSRLYVGGDVSLNGNLSIMNDVSLNGNLTMYNSNSFMTLNPNGITYNSSNNPSFPFYNTLPLSQFKYIQTLTQSVQEVLNTVASKTGPIGITNPREFTVNEPIQTRAFNATDISNITANLISDTQSSIINPESLGVIDANIMIATNDITTGLRESSTLLTFDIAGNSVLVSGNLIPTSPGAITIGTPVYPLNSINILSQNGLNFVASNPNGQLSQSSMSFNMNTGLIDLSYNGSTGSTLLTYGGNVSIGKARPTTTLDVLGTTIFNGDITQQTGNLFLNNRLFVFSDVSLAGNLYSNKNIYQAGDAILNSRVFILGDISLNSNLFVAKDASFNQRIYVHGDTSLNSNLYVARAINIIGDVSFNSRAFIRGDISLNSNLYVAKKTLLNDDLSLNGNINISGYTFLNNDEYLKGNLFITGNQFLNGNMIINGSTTNTGDTVMNSRLFLSIDASLNNRLFLTGIGYFNNDVYLNRNVYVSNDLSLNGNLSIGGSKFIVTPDTSLNGNLFVNKTLRIVGDTSLNSNLFVNGVISNNADAYMNYRLFVTGDLSLASNLLVNQRIISRGDIQTNGNIFVSGTISTPSDISTNSRLFISGDTSLNGNIFVKGFTFLNNDLSLNGNLHVNTTFVKGDSYVDGRMVVDNDVSLNANLIVAGKAFINGDVSLNGNVTVDNINNAGSIMTYGDNRVNGTMSVGSNLLVSQNANINGNMFVGGRTNLNGPLTLASDLSINGRLFVRSYAPGSIPIGAISGGAGLALGSFSNDVNIGKNFYVGGDTTLYGNLTVVQDLTLIGQLVIKQYTVNQTITTLNYQIMIAEDLSLNGRLFMTGDASINGRIFVSNDVSINGNLFVAGRTTFSQPITIGNTLTLNGNTVQNGTISTANAISIFNKDVSLNSRLFVLGTTNFTGDVSMANRLFTTSDVSLGGNLYTLGRTILNSDVSMNSRFFLASDASLSGNFYTKGRTILESDVSINNRLFVWSDTSLNGNFFTKGFTVLQSDVSMNSRLFIANDVSINSRLFVQGQSTIVGQNTVQGQSILNGDVSMNNRLTIGGPTVQNGDVSMNRRLFILGDASLNSNVYIAKRTIQGGDVSMNGRLFLGGDSSLNGGLFVAGPSVFGGDISLNNRIFATDASFAGNVSIFGNLYLKTDLRFDSLYVKNNFSFGNNLYVTGQTTTMVDCSMAGRLDVQGDVSMSSALDLNGAILARNNMNVFGVINQYNTLNTPSGTIVNNTSYVSSNASQVTLGTSSNQNVYIPGNIGIGTTSPLAPLYINKSSSSTSQAAGFYYDLNSSSVLAVNTSSAYNYSIYASNSIATSDKLISTSSVYFSDERIKTNIENIDTQKALNSIRQIEPKKYNYIDTIGQGSEPTWGFIAQEVKNTIDYSVSVSKNFIPDIYELCSIENANEITLNEKDTKNLVVGSTIKLISVLNRELLLKINKIIDNKTFSIDTALNNEDILDGKIFVYGQEIDDFNNLDKNAIFTITTAALKQVDIELQETKKIVEQQNILILSLQNQIKIINDKLQLF
jgi:predicted acyltransferase (DUF342 family)